MSERLIDSYLKGIEIRRTVRNWSEDVRAIVDEYRAHTTMFRAVEHDMIEKVLKEIKKKESTMKNWRQNWR